MHVTPADLGAIAGKKPTPLMNALAVAITKWSDGHGIDDARRMAMFLANVAVETGGFRQLEENLNYTAERLTQVWPKRFPTLNSAKPYANNPRALANFVYGGRMGNKGRPDAGWLYRGSGPMQTTGYDNFLAVEKATGLPVVANPDLLRTPDAGTRAACIFWQQNNLNAFADAGDLGTCRRAINGGTHGLADAKIYYRKALARFAEQSGPVLRQAQDEAPQFFASLPETNEASVEQALRDDGSRTIARADEVTSQSFLGNVSNFVTGAGVLSAFPYLGQMHPVTQGLIVIGLVAAGVVGFLLWRQGHAAKAIRAARVDDAMTGKNASRLSALMVKNWQLYDGYKELSLSMGEGDQ